MTKIYCDIVDINLIKKFNKKTIVKGLTTDTVKAFLSDSRKFKFKI